MASTVDLRPGCDQVVSIIFTCPTNGWLGYAHAILGKYGEGPASPRSQHLQTANLSALRFLSTIHVNRDGRPTTAGARRSLYARDAGSRHPLLHPTFAAWLLYLSLVPAFIYFPGRDKKRACFPTLFPHRGSFFLRMLTSLLWATLFAAPSWAQSPFAAGQKWQIVLTGVPDTTKSPLPPTDAPVWDIDLFDSDASTIAALQASGKIVICYFSAGRSHCPRAAWCEPRDVD